MTIHAQSAGAATAAPALDRCHWLMLRPGRDSAVRASVARECAGRLLLEIEIALLADVDAYAEDRAVRERAGVSVVLADVVAAVEADAQAVARQRELTGLRL